MLVIIGLIGGGVLVGQDLIRSATIRAQVTQIEKYNTAVNTFKGKYQAIPGDMGVNLANQFGFTVGGGCDGSTASRDNNGLIDGGGSLAPYYQGINETELFWQDLSTPKLTQLIQGTYPLGGMQVLCGSLLYANTNTQVALFLPPAQVGGNNYMYVYEYNGSNWYGILNVVGLGNYWTSAYNKPTMTALQAYSIDKKMDDGLPTTGTVQTQYVSIYGSVSQAPSNTTDASYTCYNTSSGSYSITYSGGAGANCAISFQFQ